MHLLENIFLHSAPSNFLLTPKRHLRLNRSNEKIENAQKTKS